MKIKIGIAGYGNLGRGIEYAVSQNSDMELLYIFTRRDPLLIKPVTQGIKAVSASEIKNYTNEIDVLVLCTGSAEDLPVQTPEYAKIFNVVDSFDTHAKILSHFKNTDEAAKSGNKTALISAGWDPGLFSLNRLLAETVLPRGTTYTFWGDGVSQGHSDAIRRINGVIDARQYTIPVKTALDSARSGKNPVLGTRDKHKRDCYVVIKDGADRCEIEKQIITMPDYFADYDTTVFFVSAEELEKKHAGFPHGGFVIRSGKSGCNDEHNHIMEYSLKLDSNPEFTANVLVICARAVYRLNKQGIFGCKTIFDIPPVLFSVENEDELRRKYL